MRIPSEKKRSRQETTPARRWVTEFVREPRERYGEPSPRRAVRRGPAGRWRRMVDAPPAGCQKKFRTISGRGPGGDEELMQITQPTNPREFALPVLAFCSFSSSRPLQAANLHNTLRRGCGPRPGTPSRLLSGVNPNDVAAERRCCLVSASCLFAYTTCLLLTVREDRSRGASAPRSCYLIWGAGLAGSPVVQGCTRTSRWQARSPAPGARACGLRRPPIEPESLP